MHELAVTSVAVPGGEGGRGGGGGGVGGRGGGRDGGEREARMSERDVRGFDLH